jgi:hypothetical protein
MFGGRFLWERTLAGFQRVSWHPEEIGASFSARSLRHCTQSAEVIHHYDMHRYTFCAGGGTPLPRRACKECRGIPALNRNKPANRIARSKPIWTERRPDWAHSDLRRNTPPNHAYISGVCVAERESAKNPRFPQDDIVSDLREWFTWVIYVSIVSDLRVEYREWLSSAHELNKTKNIYIC